MRKNKDIKGKLIGQISINSKGVGYLTHPDYQKDIEIHQADLGTALNQDTVEIILHPQNKHRLTGEVVKIINRAKKEFVGILSEENGVHFVTPDDSKVYVDLLIPRKFLAGAKNGQKVFAELLEWNNPRKSPEGKILKVLGDPGEHHTEMHAIALERGFDKKLSQATEQEARKINQMGIRDSDLKNRRDFRNTLTFTIDPSDAKDFDDAISFRYLEDNLYEVGIHIADVSHYVTPGSVIDQEALKRSTSVYLVDRTLPMLPEVLSNDLCSLVPHKDRLTMSAVFVLDIQGKIKSSWFGKTIIHSQKRFTYEEAEKVLHQTNLPLHKELALLNKIAKNLNTERFKNGAISLEQEEVKFVLDQNGVPLKVIKKIRGDSNRLIEEFMLLANRKVAEELSGDFKNKKNIDTNPSIYRIHDYPNPEKMEDLAFFLRSLGFKIKIKDGIINNKDLNQILNGLEHSPHKDAVNKAVIRSMAKAIYSTKNIGHYGLGFLHYTHFTSPIRRYPDIMVHRLLTDHLLGKKTKEEKIDEFETIAKIGSEQEKKATEAERASIKYKQVEYMAKHIGKRLSGVISGVSEWGLYVEDIETKSEGMIRMKDLTNDFYELDEKQIAIIGKKTKKRYRLGDKIQVKVKSVDLKKKTIDYILV